MSFKRIPFKFKKYKTKKNSGVKAAPIISDKVEEKKQEVEEVTVSELKSTSEEGNKTGN